MEEFDYVIVGAGSSGCVLADRLTADGTRSVLVLEAGSNNHTELVNMPRLFMLMWGNPKYFWQFPVKAQDRRPPDESWFYGKGLGGSSSTNGTWYMRGEPADYDGWHDQGLPEWSWAEVERCYREMESYREADGYAGRGRNGPLEVTKLPFRSRFMQASIDAAAEMGLPFLPDINTPATHGIGYSQATVDRKGRRASAYRKFLKRAMKRPNLTVLTGTLAERVLMSGKRVVGVRYRQDGQVHEVRASKSVILSAGVLQSPKLLQLSGIGPSAVLEKAGVEVLHEMPQVGCNLADHITLSLSFRLKGDPGFNREFSGWRILRHLAQYYATRTGLMAYTCPELTAMFAMGVDETQPNVQIGVGPFSMRSSEELKADPGRGALESKPGYTLNAYYLHPASRGSVNITSSDVADAPLVDARWWDDPSDMKGLIAMVRLMRDYAAQPALREFTVQEVTPGAQHQSDEEIANVLEWLAGPGLHATGTCRMGADNDAVLDSRLRVRGLQGLRVVDCSAMPSPPSGNTNAPAMMLGYRGAELIIADEKAASASATPA